jgi:hypothetical protein
MLFYQPSWMWWGSFVIVANKFNVVRIYTLVRFSPINSGGGSGGGGGGGGGGGDGSGDSDNDDNEEEKEE